LRGGFGVHAGVFAGEGANPPGGPHRAARAACSWCAAGKLVA